MSVRPVVRMSVRPSVCMYVFLRASLLMDVVILVCKQPVFKKNLFVDLAGEPFPAERYSYSVLSVQGSSYLSLT